MKKDVIRFALVCLMLAGTWAMPINLSAAETEWKPRLDFLKKYEKVSKEPESTPAAEYAKTLVAQHGKMALHAMLDEKPTNQWSDDLAIEVAKGLVSQHGIDLEQLNASEDTVLIRAALAGSLPMTKTLLFLGANVNHQNQYGDTVLIRAALEGDLLMTKTLLSLGANVNHQNQYGDTVLMRAVAKRHVPTIKLLLEHGAKVDLKNTDGGVAIMFAFDEFNLDPGAWRQSRFSIGRPRKPNREVVNILRSYDPQGYCYYQTHWQVWDALAVMDIELTREIIKMKDEMKSIPEGWVNDRKVRNMMDLYNFMGTFDVQECSTQYQFLFMRLKGSIGTFVMMYQEWGKGLVFSKYSAEDLNAQRRVQMDANRKFFDMRSPY